MHPCLTLHVGRHPTCPIQCQRWIPGPCRIGGASDPAAIGRAPPTAGGGAAAWLMPLPPAQARLVGSGSLTEFRRCSLWCQTGRVLRTWWSCPRTLVSYPCSVPTPFPCVMQLQRARRPEQPAMPCSPCQHQLGPKPFTWERGRGLNQQGHLPPALSGAILPAPPLGWARVAPPSRGQAMSQWQQGVRGERRHSPPSRPHGT